MSPDPRPVSLPHHLWVIAYDTPNNKRRRRMAKFLEGYGSRVQYSVFECPLSRSELAMVRFHLYGLADPNEDRVRFYPLCRACNVLVLRQGTAEPVSDDEYYVA